MEIILRFASQIRVIGRFDRRKGGVDDSALSSLSGTRDGGGVFHWREEKTRSATMLSRSISSSIGVAVAAYLLTFAPVSAAGRENCQAPVDPKLKGAAMSDKLRRCNGVLKPRKAADPDIVIPTPPIDDPLAIHPKEVPGGEAVPK
jgi:hypothetical protein